MTNPMPISAIVITKNEAGVIERCLSSLDGVCAEIVVVDSHSTDNTIAIAQRFTDSVITHDWEGYAGQKRFAIGRCSHDWILWIDADEQVSAPLNKEIAHLDFSHDGYFIPRKVWYLGRWIMHCGWYPGYVLRLFNRTRGTISDTLVHERVHVSGSSACLKNPLLHYPYRSIEHHLHKMNAFSTLAARQLHAGRKKASRLTIAGHTVGKFLNMYFLKRGFLDGAAGLMVSVLGSYYVFCKYAKLFELKNVAAGKDS